MELLQIFASYLKPIADILLCILSIYGVVLAIKIHNYTKRKETFKELANQVLAYYCLEQEYLAVIQEKKAKPEKKFQEEMRKRATAHDKNMNHVYPNMQPNDVKVYL